MESGGSNYWSSDHSGTGTGDLAYRGCGTSMEMSEQSFDELAKFLKAIGEPFDKIWLRFWGWHFERPDIEIQLRDLSLKALKAGLKVYGIGAIWEVLRWHLRIVNGRVEEFRSVTTTGAGTRATSCGSTPGVEGFLRSARSARSEGGHMISPFATPRPRSTPGARATSGQWFRSPTTFQASWEWSKR